MTPYIATFFMLALLSFTQFTKELKKYRLLFFLFATMYLIAFAGLRKAGVGADDGNYIETFKNVHEFLDPINGIFTYSLIELNMEYGYVLLNSILRYLTDSYTILFLLISFIAVYINSLNYYRYSNYVFLVLLLYFVHTFLYRDLNQVRAGIAAAILLFSIHTIHENQKIKTIFIILGASFFHLSSIIVFLPLIFRNYINTKKIVFILLTTSIIFSFFSVGHLILNSLPNLGPISVKLNYYLEYTEYNYNLGLLDITNIKNISLLILLLFLWERLIVKVPYFLTLMSFYSLGVSFRLIFSDFAIIAGRMSSMLTIVEVLLIPALLYAFKNKILITFFIVIYAMVILFLNLINPKFGSGIYEMSIFS